MEPAGKIKDSINIIINLKIKIDYDTFYIEYSLQNVAVV